MMNSCAVQPRIKSTCRNTLDAFQMRITNFILKFVKRRGAKNSDVLMTLEKVV